MKAHLNPQAICLLLLTSLGVGVAEEKIVVTPLSSEVKASFRGLAMRGADRVWVTGSQATVLRTIDAGESWQQIRVPAEPVANADGKLVPPDFRDAELLPDGSVILMSIGNGAASKLLRSADDGRTWQTVLTNRDPAGFFDGMTFTADGRRGLLYGDPIQGRLDLYLTDDAGKTWTRLPPERRPRLQDGEYGFAASGSGAAMIGEHIWVGTGGSVARVLHSADGGRTWTAVRVDMTSGVASAGIFSLAFADRNHAVAVGGDYLKPDLASRNVATSSDGGRTWSVSETVSMPHKACVRWLGGQRFLTCGRTGIAFSDDRGKSWQTVSTASYYTCVFDQKSRTGFLAGKDGRIARLNLVR